MKSKIKNLEKGFFVKYIIATLCLVSIFAVAIAHSKYMDQKVSDISKVYLSKITVQNADIVLSQIQGNLLTLDVLARMIGNHDDSNMDEIREMLNEARKSSEFISMGVVLHDGSIGFTPIPLDGREGSELLLPSDWDLINKMMAGYAGLSGSPSRLINGKRVSIYARPIYRNLQIAGVFVAFFNEKFFDNLVLPRTVDKNGCTYIADKDGNIIFDSEDCYHEGEFAKVIRTLSTGWSLGGDEGDKLREDIGVSLSGTIEYFQDKEGMYISYAPINFDDWYLVSIAATSIAEAQSKGIYDDILRAFIYLLLITMTLIIYFIYMRNQNFKRLKSKMRLESINDESYRMIMEQTDDIIFEYDTRDKTYFHTSNFRKNFGYEPTKTGFLGSVEYDYVHPDDVIRFVEMYEKMKKDRCLTETEIRIINSEGDYLWTRIYILGVFDSDDGRLAKVIGKIVNVDEKKKEILHLKEMAVMDSATGVYNKQTTEDMIDAFLEGEGKHGRHAILIIDIDDFKGVNDDHGHRIGDVVISVLGMELSQIFRATDIKGRIGGDEFMILMKDIEGVDYIVNKAKTICQIFRDREIEANKKINVSTSIGIALYDKDGSTYEELYEAADRALYNCKSIQKGTFSFCMDAEGKISTR